jgi:tetratricopeptide (TPR) repeat protein
MPDSAEPGPPQGAVFLSYASQDAEAAKRICEALRGAGIEVWFDQSELRGGDAWDAKIRKQIKECALFVPVISAGAQARSEGYFRREWKLAVERTHDIADHIAFLLPVVLDATTDREAHVPDKFRDVQWTRLPGGETPAAFCERVKKLLSGSVGEHEQPLAATRGSAFAGDSARKGVAASAGKPNRPWVLPTVIGLIAILLVSFILRPRRSPKEVADLVALAQTFSEPKAAPVSEARQFVAKAWEQLNKTELGPEELEFADGYCKRAAELDPTDAEVWAAWSQVDTWYVYHSFDSASERQEAARSKAARALKLAPDSYEARLAQACYLVRGATERSGHFEVSAFAPEADRLLRRLLHEKPDEPRALFALGILLRNLDHLDEAKEAFTRLARNSGFAATAWSELGWAELGHGYFASAEEPLERSLAIQPFWGNLSLKVRMALIWYGDLASAKAALDEIPASVMQTDYGVGVACDVFYARREPDAWLKFLQGVPRDWLHSNRFDGPTRYWIGVAQRMAGRNDAARIEWQAALKLVEHRLADQPTDAGLLFGKGALLTELGEYAEAEKALNQSAELRGRKPSFLDLRIAQGRIDEAMDILESRPITAADLRLDPDYDPLRDNPRFKSLLARAEADPKKSPNAPKVPADAPVPKSSRN